MSVEDTTDSETQHPSQGPKASDDTAPRKGDGLDPRIFAYRDDLAAQSLYGRVNAKKFVAGEKGQVVRAAIALRKQPDANAGLETEALFGEQLAVYEINNGWAWVQLARDSYVGYMPADAISTEITPATHWVRTNGTFVYPLPTIKSPPRLHLSLTSEVTLKDNTSKAPAQFSELTTGGFILKKHIAPRHIYARDYVVVAERLIETPYLWGGRTRIGIDCSGLVQVALHAAGLAAPRDSDLQQSQLGEPIALNADLDGLQRGDLVFWDGHVAIMVDGVMMVHANAHHMAVAIEPLPEAASRIARETGPIQAIRRLKRLSAQA